MLHCYKVLRNEVQNNGNKLLENLTVPFKELNVSHKSRKYPSTWPYGHSSWGPSTSTSFHPPTTATLVVDDHGRTLNVFNNLKRLSLLFSLLSTLSKLWYLLHTTDNDIEAVTNYRELKMLSSPTFPSLLCLLTLFCLSVSAYPSIPVPPKFTLEKRTDPFFPDEPASCPICAQSYPSINSCAQAAPVLSNFSMVCLAFYGDAVDMIDGIL